MEKKGQISIEYLIVVGFITALVIGMVGIAFIYTGGIEDEIKFNQLESFAKKLVSSAESVFYAGEPSKVEINAYLPRGVDGISIDNREIIFNITTSSGLNSIGYSSNVNVTGSISPSEGTKRIQIIAQSDKVLITQN